MMLCLKFANLFLTFSDPILLCRIDFFYNATDDEW